MKSRRQRELQPNSKDKRDKILDLTGLKPVRKRNTVRSGLGDTSITNSSNDVVFFTIPESNSKGLDSDREDEYAKYDQMFDGAADQILINSGATILHSEIEISDSRGNNRRLVRRDPDEWKL